MALENSQEEKKRRRDLREYYILERELLEKQDAKLQSFEPVITKEMQDIKQQISCLNAEIKEIKQEMGSLGLFKFKERNELIKKISTLNRSIKAQENSLAQIVKKQKDDINAQIADYKNEIIDRMLSTLLKYGFGHYCLEYDFGHYEINHPIEWLVLDRDGTRVLLISKYLIGNHPFDELLPLLSSDEKEAIFWADPTRFIELAEAHMKACKWENSQIKGWLNHSFKENAFYPEEANIIESVFLLSIQEAEHYFTSDSARKCQLSEHLSALREKMEKANLKDVWCLRSNGTSTRPGYIAYVRSDGSICHEGMDGYAKLMGTRPAIWIDLKKCC